MSSETLEKNTARDTLRTKQYIGQQKALEKCRANLKMGKRGTLLNCGMGTGKTRMAIEWIKEIKRNTPKDKTLVVVIACPVALLPEEKAANPGGWMGEFRKWYGVQADTGEAVESMPVLYMARKGTCRERVGTMTDLCTAHASGTMRGIPLILAQSYDSWRQPDMIRLLGSIGRTKTFEKLLICDESHRCKSPNSATTKTMHSFAKSCDHTLLLTGTPMPHNPLDVWAQALMVDSTAFGPSYFGFRGKYANMRQLQGRQQMFVGMKANMLPDFKARFDTFAYTLSVEDALDLPPVTHNILNVELSSPERAAYDRMKKELIVEFKEKEALNTISAANVLSQIGKLSQITGGSIKDEAGNIVTLGRSKAMMVKELLTEDIPENEPVVVFTRYKADLAQIHEVAKQAGRVCYELSGNKKELEQWRAATGGEVIAIQQSAGGTGIDLTRSHYVIYFSKDYSMGTFDQSVARLHRAGQDFPVACIHLLVPDSIDWVIHESIINKRNIVNAALGMLGVEVQEEGEYNPEDWNDLWGDDNEG
jgi:SNF2 family DNA or RNA helicase